MWTSEQLQLISTATPFTLLSNRRALQAWPRAQRGGKRQQRALLSGAADAGARGRPAPGAAGLEASAAAAGPRADGLIDLRRALGTTTPVQQAGLRAPRDHRLAGDLLRCEWICRRKPKIDQEQICCHDAGLYLFAPKRLAEIKEAKASHEIQAILDKRKSKGSGVLGKDQFTWMCARLR